MQIGIYSFFFSESVVAGVKKEWVNCWDSLGSICLNAAELGHALRTGKKNRKRRAFTDLLKMLEACGLSKHRPVNTMVLERFVSVDTLKPFLTCIIDVYVLYSFVRQFIGLTMLVIFFFLNICSLGVI